ncbi:bifunctional 2-polyprenyl-6-hydroxyphenol methylase/3-demethylubiquinol 3-O-methyltransferase UbiG [Vitiosangium sp. GDMCC 1.1324]|uniref:class I SAM-dependent methyltransferase n=1 Tax=Vitiosangium sp. (strain GDMCC 1.1324) TaxID=2138576 RepID=UPI000D350224|nr:class I SAM-dependent methyltransferase [Vitiosangium sp. GDMCC 1.1324]PTL79054.1 class I SAM-dependent methyltransferase [Vitiosangium sp. GDMCC 1.1324]
MPEQDRQRWNTRYREQVGTGEPSGFLRSLADRLPRTGRALDVAGGAGHDALWLARRGLDVTLADISDVALERAAEAARGAGVELRLQRLDVELEPLPPGPFDLVLCLNFLWRPLFAELPKVLAPGGLLVFAQPTRSNLQRHAHPSARFLLEDGELPRLLQGLEIVSYSEGWTEEGRHEARLVARA